MNKVLAIACLVVPAVAASGCQDDSSPKAPETIIVSDQLAANARYDIDLTRNDAVYFLSPGLDGSRLSVICPTLAAISFGEYVVSRIRPTGAKYDPTSHILHLANASVPQETLTRWANATYEVCEYSCIDYGAYEDCQTRCVPDPPPNPEP